MNKYLQETKMLDFNHSSIQRLIEEKQWLKYDSFQKIKKIYNFVRDNIVFGYNTDDNLKASEVLNDTYIQKEGINHDFGVFNSPDEFFEKYQQQLPAIKKWIYINIGRKLMNRNVKRIRA